MALNALESEMVTFTGTPGTTYTASSGEQLSIGYVPKYESRTSTEIKYQAIEQRTSDVSGGNNLNRGQYYIQLGEQLYDGKLTKRYARDDFERPSINWQYNGKDIGTYVDYELLVSGGSFTTGVKGSEMYDLLTFTTIDENNLLNYIDGVEGSIVKGDLRRSNKDDLAGTGTGVLTEVFFDQSRDEIIITSINTYLAKANSDYNSTSENLSLNVYTGSSGNRATSNTKIVDSKDVPQVADVKKDEYKLVYMSGKESASSVTDYARFAVVNMFDTEILSDSEITKFAKSNDNTVTSLNNKVVKSLTSGGTNYDTNVKAYYDYRNVLYDYDNQLLSDMSYNLYLDRYSNVIGVDLFEGNLNYVFITGYDRAYSNISVRTAEAAAIFTDGTMDTITVNVTNTNNNIDAAKAGNHDYDEYDKWASSANNDVAAKRGDRNLNRWYTYTVNSNGTYNLKPVKNFAYTTYTSFPDSGNTKILDCANLFLDDGSALTSKGRIYGENESIYITVEPGVVDTSVGGTALDAITKVKGVYTGAQDIKVELDAGSKGTVNNDKTKSPAVAQESSSEFNAYVYSIFDNNGYIIASILMGEAQGGSANYVYVLGGAKNERVDHGSATRAAEDDTYYWEFDAVVDGVETTLTVKDKYSDTLKSNLNVHAVVEVRYDGQYVTDIDYVDADDIFYYKADGKQIEEIEKRNIFDSGNITANQAWKNDNEGEIQPTTGLKDENKNTIADTWNKRIEGTIYVQGDTLYVNYDDPNVNDIGLALNRNGCKAVLIQPENGKEKVNSCGSVAEAVSRMKDRNDNLANTQFKGRIVAVLDSRGVAQWVVLISDTNVPTGKDPNYGNYTGNVSVASNETGKLTVLNGSSIRVDGYSAYLTLNLDAPDWADAVNTSAGDLNLRATLMMDGVAYDYVDLASGTGATNLKATTTAGKTTYEAVLPNAFSNTTWKLLLNQVDTSKHNFSVVLSNISYAKANVKYVYADGTAVPSGALTGPTASLSTTTGGNVKVQYTKASDSAYELKDGATLTYKVENVTKVSAGSVPTSGNLTDTVATTVDTVRANGNDWVVVTIGGMTKKAVTPPTPGQTYTVKANSAYNGKIKFAVVGTAPTDQAGIDAIAASEWKDSVSAANDKIVLIKSAETGVKLASVTAIDTNEGDSVTINQQIGATGVFKYTVAGKDVTVKAVTTDKVSVEKGTIKSDASIVNLKTDKSTTGLTEAEKFQLAIDYVNDKTSYTATPDTDLDGNVTGMKINGKTVTTLNINNNLAVVKIDGGEDVVAGAVAGTATVKSVLDLKGKTITGAGANVFVVLDKGASGKAGVATTTTGSDISDTVLTDVADILTNNGNGYAKMAAASTYTATKTANVGAVAGAEWTVTKNDTKILNDGTQDYLPIGVAVNLKVKPNATVAAADNATGITFSGGSMTGCTVTVSTTTAFAAGELTPATEATVSVTVTATSRDACTIVLTPANVTPAP